MIQWNLWPTRSNLCFNCLAKGLVDMYMLLMGIFLIITFFRFLCNNMPCCCTRSVPKVRRKSDIICLSYSHLMNLRNIRQLVSQAVVSQPSSVGHSGGCFSTYFSWSVRQLFLNLLQLVSQAVVSQPSSVGQSGGCFSTFFSWSVRQLFLNLLRQCLSHLNEITAHDP